MTIRVKDLIVEVEERLSKYLTNWNAHRLGRMANGYVTQWIPPAIPAAATTHQKPSSTEQIQRCREGLGPQVSSLGVTAKKCHNSSAEFPFTRVLQQTLPGPQTGTSVAPGDRPERSKQVLTSAQRWRRGKPYTRLYVRENG